jgi:PleD family two-component response regulator
LDGFTLAASVGVAWSSGTGVTAEALLTDARASLQRAKAQR